MQLKIINTNELYTHIALSGPLDCEGVSEIFEDFHHAVTERGFPAIVDLTEVGFISSIGLRTLVSCAKTLSGKHACLVLYNPQPLVTDELKLAGLEKDFFVTNDFGTALRLVTEKQKGRVVE